jgi:CarD family transcriptional regulator
MTKVATKTKAKPVTKIVAKAKPVAKTVNKTKPALKVVSTKKTTATKTPVKTSVKTPVKAIAKAVAKKVVVAKAAPKTVSKIAAKKVAPIKAVPAAKKAVAAVVAPKVTKTMAKPTTAPMAANQNTLDFKVGDMVVYPAHGVGQVEGIEVIEMLGQEVTLYAIHFTKDRMRLKLPLAKVKTSGLRKLSSADQMAEAMTVMKGRARIRRVMWSRRAQEYEAKINSGSPVAVAEVLRDLRRNVTGVEQSYSERQIFQSALERLASELAAIEKVAELDAAQKLEQVLREAA